MAATASDYEKAQAAEWGTYVATVAIDIDGTRAFNPGDPIPVSHVDNGRVPEGSYARRATKAADAVLNQEA